MDSGAQEVSMFARVSDVTVPSDNVDAAVQAYRQLVLAPLQGMDGYQRAYLLVDRDSGHALSISLWDSLDAMRGSEEAADRLRDQVTETAGGGQATVSRYEVVVIDPEH
jgi:heme-degrading monooxygenase HmoA